MTQRDIDIQEHILDHKEWSEDFEEPKTLADKLSVLIKRGTVTPVMYEGVLKLVAQYHNVFKTDPSCGFEFIEDLDEIEDLFNETMRSQVWGTIRWVIRKTRTKPIEKFINTMHHYQVWDDEFDSYESP